MTEVDEAAKIISAAADPDANIIFGATINPELEGEVIITVVATGFDASYFAGRAAKLTGEEAGVSATSSAVTKPEKVDEADMKDMDMDLDEEATDFTSDKPMPNIWAIDEEESSDDKKNDETAISSESEPVVSDHMENELEKPSFLRRLSRRHKNDDISTPEDDKDNTDKK